MQKFWMAGSVRRVKKCLDAGMDGYVSKPIKLSEITAAIQETSLESTGRSASVDTGLSIIDLSELDEIAGGDRTFMNAILQKIVLKMEPSFDAMEELLSEGKWQELRAMAHSLKSSSGYAGSAQLTQVLQEIETQTSGTPQSGNISQLLQKARNIGRGVVLALQSELKQEVS